jgi:hypothetical protein
MQMVVVHDLGLNPKRLYTLTIILYPILCLQNLIKWLKPHPKYQSCHFQILKNQNLKFGRFFKGAMVSGKYLQPQH